MFYNRILLITFIAWLCTQLAKAIIYWIINKSFSVERLFGDGGMPSVHSAVVMALATSVGLQCGWDSPFFAIAGILALIVMHDAVGVRHETGKQAKVLNNILSLLQPKGEGEQNPAETLKELVGHTGPQVIVGALGGTITAFLLNMVLP